MMTRRRRTPATAMPTIAMDEMLILLSATPITSKPVKIEENIYTQVMIDRTLILHMQHNKMS